MERTGWRAEVLCLGSDGGTRAVGAFTPRWTTEVGEVVVRTIVEDEDEGRTVGQAGTRPLSTGTRAELDQAGLSPSVIELLPKSSKDRHVCMLLMLHIRLIGFDGAENKVVPSNMSKGTFGSAGYPRGAGREPLPGRG